MYAQKVALTIFINTPRPETLSKVAYCGENNAIVKYVGGLDITNSDDKDLIAEHIDFFEQLDFP